MTRKEYVRMNSDERQLLDYYIIKEFKNGNIACGYAKRVQKNLQENHTIRTQGGNVYQRVKGVLAGACLRPAADVDGTPSRREGKDQNYAGFLSLVDCFLPKREDRSYIGLPANQLDVISSIIGGHIFAVERDRERALELEQLNIVVKKRRNSQDGDVHIICGDIFDVMRHQGPKQNVIDLDMMCPLPEDSMSWAAAIESRAQDLTVLHVTTCIGECRVSEKEYETRAHRFTANLVSCGFIAAGHSRFRYVDRVVPMRCERYVLWRQT